MNYDQRTLTATTTITCGATATITKRHRLPTAVEDPVVLGKVSSVEPEMLFQASLAQHSERIPAYWHDLSSREDVVVVKGVGGHKLPAWSSRPSSWHRRCGRGGAGASLCFLQIV